MKYFLLTLILLPYIALAAPSNFKELVDVLLGIVNSIIPLIFTLTIFVIIWGIVKTWILHGDDASEIEKGRKFIVVGVVVLVIMTGLWGAVALIRSSLFG